MYAEYTCTIYAAQSERAAIEFVCVNMYVCYVYVCMYAYIYMYIYK